MFWSGRALDARCPDPVPEPAGVVVPEAVGQSVHRLGGPVCPGVQAAGPCEEVEPCCAPRLLMRCADIEAEVGAGDIVPPSSVVAAGL